MRIIDNLDFYLNEKAINIEWMIDRNICELKMLLWLQCNKEIDKIYTKSI